MESCLGLLAIVLRIARSCTGRTAMVLSLSLFCTDLDDAHSGSPETQIFFLFFVQFCGVSCVVLVARTVLISHCDVCGLFVLAALPQVSSRILFHDHNM